MHPKKRTVAALSLLGGVLLAASCGGKAQEAGSRAGTGGWSQGDGDGDTGDGDGDTGDGDGDAPSTGGTGGTTDGAGGDPPAGGGSSTGGSTPTGGAPSTGGDNSTGGDGGSDGTGGDDGTPPPVTLGEPCDAPGGLACDDVNHHLALTCGGNGDWELRETCTGEDVCDSNEGAGFGTCRTPLAECEMAAGPFCDGDTRLVECAPGGFETSVVEECEPGYGCQGSSCSPVDDECPEVGPNTILCADDDCGTRSDNCRNYGTCENTGEVVLTEGAPQTLRLPKADLCSGFCQVPAYIVDIALDAAPDSAVKITVGPGWGFVSTSTECAAPDQSGCRVLPPRDDIDTYQVLMVPDPLAPVVRNVVVEAVEPGTTCD